MSSEILNPVKTPGLLYPEFGKLKPGRRYYKCPKCDCNMRTRLQVQVVRHEDLVFGFQCDDCGKKWFVSSKLIFNDIFEEELLRMARFTKKTGKEFGALIIKTPDGIRLDMIEVGENMSVSFQQTHKLKENEKIVGSAHNHPYSDLPSDFDIASFLRDDWEKISVVNGAKGTITVMVKTDKTLKIDEVEPWIKENEGSTLKEKGMKYNFLVFKGKANNLQLVAGLSKRPFTSLEMLLREIE